MQCFKLVMFLLAICSFSDASSVEAQSQIRRPAPRLVRSSLETTQNAYYGREFYEKINNGSRDLPLKSMLKNILTANHIKVTDDFDQILTESCSSRPGCYRHRAIGYDNARLFLMGYYYLVQTSTGYGVREVYCGRIYSQSEFGNEPPAPQKIPNGNIVNTEHTWPQSRFNPKASIEEQKSDLHHLFPTDSQLNSVRGNHEFGQVTMVTEKLRCSASKAGHSKANSGIVFEPPDAHKGNAARAIFYFSTRYNLPISLAEETVLKSWNQLDPVDQEELTRNDAIFKVEGSRNPYVDYSELADRISDF